jgi:flagellar hook-length control protein FliK
VVAAPSRSAADRGSAFDDMLQAAARPARIRPHADRSESPDRADRPEGVHRTSSAGADRPVRTRSSDRAADVDRAADPGRAARVASDTAADRADAPVRKVEDRKSVSSDPEGSAYAVEGDGTMSAGDSIAAQTTPAQGPAAPSTPPVDSLPAGFPGAMAAQPDAVAAQAAAVAAQAAAVAAQAAAVAAQADAIEAESDTPDDRSDDASMTAAAASTSAQVPDGAASPSPTTIATLVAAPVSASVEGEAESEGSALGGSGASVSSGSPGHGAGAPATGAARSAGTGTDAAVPTAATPAASSLGESRRAMGEFTVRVSDAAPSADAGTQLSAAPSSAPPPGATPALAQSLTSSASSPQGIPAPVLPGRPVHAGHPPLSAQIGAELLTLREAADGGHIVTVAVSPDNLGPVTISAVVGKDGMSVELFSPSAEGRDALKQLLPDLRRDLTSTGGSGSSLDLGARDAPQDRPRPRESTGGGHVVEPRFRAAIPAVLHPSSARLDVLV